jgi:hypothetical protein
MVWSRNLILFFECGDPVVSTLFSENIIHSSLNYLGTLVKNELTTNIVVYFWTLIFILLMCTCLVLCQLHTLLTLVPLQQVLTSQSVSLSPSTWFFWVDLNGECLLSFFQLQVLWRKHLRNIYNVPKTYFLAFMMFRNPGYKILGI